MNIELSVIAPLYNEEDSIRPLHQAIEDVLSKTSLNYEIIFIDDGSKDKTVAIGKALVEKNPRLKFIEFRKNYGQTAAMSAGIDTARGEILVTMDGDLQNDPSDIPMMLDKLKEGYDIVVGWRHNRKDKLITRRIPSVIANRLIGRVTGVPIKDNGCSLKVYRATLMKNVPFYSEMHRFIPAILSLSGAKIAEVKVNHHARQFGESKYGLSRIYKVILDLITIKTMLSLTSHPVVWFSKLAIPPFLMVMLCSLILMQQLILGNPIVVISSVVLLFLSLTVFLIGLGFLCELIYQSGTIKIEKLAILAADIQSQHTNSNGVN